MKNMDLLKEELLNHLSLNNSAFLKYQQRDEEEMSVCQRKVIAENLLSRSITMFLNRFGRFMNKEHFQYFDQLSFDDKDKDDMIKSKLSNILYNLIKYLLLFYRTSKRSRMEFGKKTVGLS